MSLPIYLHLRTDTGREREHNEDCADVAELQDGSRLLVVCDGMGGHGGGEIASRIAVDAIVGHVREHLGVGDRRQVLYDALLAAHAGVLDASRSPEGVPGMGTTAVVAWIYDDQLLAGWVGDSRLYWFRGGKVAERSRDHTRVEEMVRVGILRRGEERHHPDAHILSRAIGGAMAGGASLTPEVWGEAAPLEAGDVVLLCSDGLHDLLEDRELYPLVAGLRYEDATARLVDEANHRGGHDNITVALAVAGDAILPAAAPGAARRDTSPDGPALEGPFPGPTPPGAVAAGPAAALEPGSFRDPTTWLALGIAALVGAALGVGFYFLLRA